MSLALQVLHHRTMLTYHKYRRSVSVPVTLSNKVRAVLDNPVPQPTRERQPLLTIGGIEDQGARQAFEGVEYLFRWYACPFCERHV